MFLFLGQQNNLSYILLFILKKTVLYVRVNLKNACLRDGAAVAGGRRHQLLFAPDGIVILSDFDGPVGAGRRLHWQMKIGRSAALCRTNVSVEVANTQVLPSEPFFFFTFGLSFFCFRFYIVFYTFTTFNTLAF